MPRPSRRTEVRASAARLIREYGYESATMDLLAEAVGLNKGTLYHYYPAKSAILYELLSTQIDATLELTSQVPASGPIVDRMRTFVRLQVEHVSKEQDEIVVFFQELPWIERTLPEDQATQLRKRTDEYQSFASRLIDEGVRTGDFRKVDTRVILYSIVGMLAYIPGWFHGGSPRKRAALVDELTDFVMGGIVA